MILHVYSLTVDIAGYVHRAKMVPVFFSKIYSGNLSCAVSRFLQGLARGAGVRGEKIGQFISTNPS
jgi:hypothetical protein